MCYTLIPDFTQEVQTLKPKHSPIFLFGTRKEICCGELHPHARESQKGGEADDNNQKQTENQYSIGGAEKSFDHKTWLFIKLIK